VSTLAEKKKCFPECDFFRCGNRAKTPRGNKAWCKWTDEECLVNCNYAICVRKRLLPKDVCGENLKRKTVETLPEEEIKPVVRLRGKTLRRIGDKELF